MSFFFYLRSSIIKAIAGKSAVASAAYLSATSLYCERLGQHFQYRNKEEVAFSEVLLPKYAPPEYASREALWNAVEAKENKSNSRYARQFIIALPKQWSDDECIERTREFLKYLTDSGMAVDWAYHKKDTNPHIHVQCTVRGFNPNGTWAQMEKKVYVLDEDGNRVPEIDQITGEQKIRMKKKNGKEYPEKIWKRTTVQSNNWNSKAFFQDVKKHWAETCNRYLPMEEQIDYRSYKEQGINRVPLIHESAASRQALKRGVINDDVRENMERRAINRQLAQLEQFIVQARQMLEELKRKLREWKEQNEQRRSIRTTHAASGDGAITERISRTPERNAGRDEVFEERRKELENKTKNMYRRKRH